MFEDYWTGKTIGTALAQAAEVYGAREAFVFPGRRMSFRDLGFEAQRVARAFLRLGLRPGDRVGVWMAGHSEWASLFYGLAKAGIVIVPINSRYKHQELEYVFRKSRINALIFKDEIVKNKDYKSILAEVLQNTEFSDLRWIIAISGQSLPGWMSFDRLIQEATREDDGLVEGAERKVHGTDVALIQFTSGTTGFPKGAQLYHEAMLRASAIGGGLLRLGCEDRFFSPLPFYHVGGSIRVMLAPVISGCTAVVQPYFDATEALRLMEQERCTATIGHQPHWIEYLNHPDLRGRRLVLRVAIAGPNAELRRAVEETFCPSLLGFSMTETHLAGTMCSLDDPREARIRTAGCPMPGVELEIRDLQTGKPLPQGQAGEICFRGWCVMKGYFDDPQKTREAVDEAGWFGTGDLGFLDEEGRLVFTGRTKDVLRVGGEMFSALEVEEYLRRRPDVKEAAVLARQDPRLTEVCVAFVELTGSSKATKAELVDYCRKGLASFKVPREIYLVDDWPMSTSGKVQKFVLKERLHSDGE